MHDPLFNRAPVSLSYAGVEGRDSLQDSRLDELISKYAIMIAKISEHPRSHEPELDRKTEGNRPTIRDQ